MTTAQSLPQAQALPPARARAQVWEGAGAFRLSDVARPELAAGEVLVRLTTATICGSDRHTVSGRRNGACPSVLGHEGVGTVAASRRPGVEVGQRIAFAVTAPCGTCRRCRRGLTAKCGHVRKVGHEGYDGSWSLSGTYASHIHLLAGQAIAPVPEAMPDAVAAIAGCAGATVMAVLAAAGDLTGRTVLVNGVGMLGLLAVAAARDRGAAHIVACDPSGPSRALAAEHADEVVAPGGRHTVDVALELSGSAAGVETCLESLDIGGTAVLAGTVTPVGDVALDPESTVRGWRTITGVHNYEPRHLPEAVTFLAGAGAALPWERILGAPIRLEELADAFERPDGSLRTPVVVDSADERQPRL